MYRWSSVKKPYLKNQVHNFIINPKSIIFFYLYYIVSLDTITKSVHCTSHCITVNFDRTQHNIYQVIYLPLEDFTIY